MSRSSRSDIEAPPNIGLFLEAAVGKLSGMWVALLTPIAYIAAVPTRPPEGPSFLSSPLSTKLGRMSAQPGAIWRDRWPCAWHARDHKLDLRQLETR